MIFKLFQNIFKAAMTPVQGTERSSTHKGKGFSGKVSIHQLLNVPFQEKEEAKRLGARWSAPLRRWFIPRSVDPAPFASWIDNPITVKTQATVYFVRSFSRCWKCKSHVTVMTLGAESAIAPWLWDEEPFYLFSYIQSIPSHLLGIIKRTTSNYRLTSSKAAEETYYMNRCSHCQAPLGDHFLFEEPGGAFCPTSVKEIAEKITLINSGFTIDYQIEAVEDDNEYRNFAGLGASELPEEDIWNYAKRTGLTTQ
jgi:hypothetical protein